VERTSKAAMVSQLKPSGSRGNSIIRDEGRKLAAVTAKLIYQQIRGGELPGFF
jgi:hypothetical protein